MKTNTWHILGAGAIGGLFACRLQASGIDVTLCSRENAPEEQTIVLNEDNQTRSHHFVCQPTTELSPITHLLLTTKSFDAEEALTSVAHRLDQHSVIVVMMNGDASRRRTTCNSTALRVYFWLNHGGLSSL